MAQDQNELFIVETESGEWMERKWDGGYSVFSNRAEAQDALDDEAVDAAEAAHYKIVRFVRVSTPAAPETLPDESQETEQDRALNRIFN